MDHIKIQKGHRFCSNSSAAEEDDVFHEITAWGGAATVTYSIQVEGDDELVEQTSVAIAAGASIKGYITELTVASGTVLAYYYTRGTIPDPD
jgi:hypothetical protein